MKRLYAYLHHAHRHRCSCTRLGRILRRYDHLKHRHKARK